MTEELEAMKQNTRDYGKHHRRFFADGGTVNPGTGPMPFAAPAAINPPPITQNPALNPNASGQARPVLAGSTWNAGSREWRTPSGKSLNIYGGRS